MSAKKVEGSSALRDPYEVLSISKDANDQEIKSAYTNLSHKYHPDKNANNNVEDSNLFNEAELSYRILSDPEKRRQYDNGGFEVALEANEMDMEIDLSNFGTVNTMLVALFRNLGVPFKTSVSANVLEEAMNGTVTVRPLPDMSFGYKMILNQNKDELLAGLRTSLTNPDKVKMNGGLTRTTIDVKVY
ncbi:PREDICTED: chaperone protein dnaJ 15-like [Camelina sativa]|uniref:Chaperone protein dnaJ 15-like n=1 Tax=Camelina sativa TaxID=90675 RepID=A0ABM0T0T0_CAMSA|nr:PREDICTED: chaperone protein dnaJ 15-like [Camelina sativa]